MLRNKEIRHFSLLYIIMSAGAITIGFTLHTAAGFLATGCAVAFGTAFLLFTRARYKSIARISNQIDRVLHNADHLFIADAEEGELSILHSEITKMTQRIRDQNRELIKEKGHLADSLADIAHQLRTPLTSVNLIMTLLANSPAEEERKAFIRETEELLMQMDWLITSLLKLSRLDAGIVVFQSGPIAVNGLLRTAVRPFLIQMELRNVDLRIDCPARAVIQGDSAWLPEAIQNILKNCLESAGENGKIELICSDNPLYTELTVHDNGPGFSKEEIPRLFDRYYRGSSPNHTGYGIGLALCKLIITRQGGSVTAHNHPQGGALFRLRFPK
ncbi:HAMP domain-containing sensor histidine kinase [Paenibacillus sp. FSL P4-0338]|uniref:sensor histidine kinase n=1 Tax=Paenibacillus sp. FSL P4-0338 TaxID=2921635 RepID=UPI0030FCFD25